MASESAEAARFSRDTRNTSKQSSRSKTIKSTITIIVDNTDAFLQWIPEYKVIVYREYEYTIGSIT
jgi:hypothetical protein